VDPLAEDDLGEVISGLPGECWSEDVFMIGERSFAEVDHVGRVVVAEASATPGSACDQNRCLIVVGVINPGLVLCVSN
jgi:hypothetical protein